MAQGCQRFAGCLRGQTSPCRVAWEQGSCLQHQLHFRKKSWGKGPNISSRMGLFPQREQDLKTKIGPVSGPDSVPRVEPFFRKNQVQREIWQVNKELLGPFLREVRFLLALTCLERDPTEQLLPRTSARLESLGALNGWCLAVLSGTARKLFISIRPGNSLMPQGTSDGAVSMAWIEGLRHYFCQPSTLGVLGFLKSNACYQRGSRSIPVFLC